MESISALFNEFSYRPRQSAGQNFLADLKILDKIDQAIQCPVGDVILEVGGGYGVLTERLANKGVPLTVVESDQKLFAMLERKWGKNGTVSLVKADILKWDLSRMRIPSGGKITVAGNIPYYLTTPLITGLLTHHHSLLRRIFVMVQREVAERLIASPGTKAYGALTLCAQYYAKVRKLLDVPAPCFKPKPKVDSAFVEFELKPAFPLDGEGERLFFSLVRSIFQSRRKILSNSLKSLGKPQYLIDQALKIAMIDPRIRGERLSLEKLVELSLALESVAL